MPGGGGPSALRWMAAGAEFPGRWWGIGAALDALWGECGIGAVGKGVESMLWWMRCGERCGIDAVVDAL